MQRSNSPFFNLDQMINLSEHLSEQSLTHLSKVFPQLKLLNPDSLEIKRNKFYSMIIEKIKSYFEINEKFIIAECLSILLNDINKVEENLTKTNYSRRNKLSNGTQKTMDKKSLSKKILKRNTNFDNDAEKKVHFANFDDKISAQPYTTRTSDVYNKSNLKKKPSIRPNKTEISFYEKEKSLKIFRQKSNGKPLKEHLTEKNNQFKFDLLKNVNKELLENINNENFNIFEIDKKIGPKNILPFISIYIYNSLHFDEILKNRNIFENFVTKISEGYNRTNPYHNDLHAADTTHTFYTYLEQGKINEICGLNKISLCSLFLSCICHDYKHPGVNNNYLKETNSSLSILYNDESVLENMHISETFKLINSNKNLNIFDNMDKSIYKTIRKQMILCVLHTDMTKHEKNIDFMNKYIKNKENSSNQEFMNLIIHSTDISNPTKKFNIYCNWAELILEEFYTQGDKEKKLGLNCSFDRNMVSLYEIQLGFIYYIEIPFSNFFTQVFPKLNYLIENLNDNKKKLTELRKK